MNQSDKSNHEVSLSSTDQENKLTLKGATYDVETISKNPALIIATLTELKDLIERNNEMRTEIKKKGEEIKLRKMKVAFVDTVLASKSLFPVTIIAKELEMTAASLNKILQEKGVQHKVGSQWFLNSHHDGMGYTGKGTNKGTKAIKWTERGRMFIHSLVERREAAPEITPSFWNVASVC